MSDTAREINYIHANDEIPSIISDRLMESESLIKYRKQALEAFRNLPVDRDTLFYKYTNFLGLDFDQLKPVIPNTEIIEVPDELNNKISLLKDQTSGFLLETSSGVVYSYRSETAKSNGVIVSDLGRALEYNEELVTSLFKKRLYGEHDDKLAALNGALASNRSFIYIPKNVILEKPIRRIILHDAPNQAIFSELSIFSDINSSAGILEEFYSYHNSHNPSLLSSVEEIHVGANSNIKLAQIQSLDLKTILLSNRRVSFNPSGKFTGLTHLQGANLSRVTNELHLNSPGCDAQDLYTMHGTGTQRFDVKSHLSHEVENTLGATSAKCIMRNHAEATLRGMIHITSEGRNADSWLKADGLLNNKGRFNAVPALAIDNNEVRAAHAATVSQIDEGEIFYLLTRGIDESTARKLIMTSYLEPIFALFKDKSITNLVRQISMQKWIKDSISNINLHSLPESEDFDILGALDNLN